MTTELFLEPMRTASVLHYANGGKGPSQALVRSLIRRVSSRTMSVRLHTSIMTTQAFRKTGIRLVSAVMP